MHDEKEKKREKSPKEEAEEVKEILGAVSTEVPALIKNILASIFSEEAGRNMGKAAAAFYKELKDGGMPNDVALKMTEDYMSTFTNLGNILKQVGKSKSFIAESETQCCSPEKQVEQKIAKEIKKDLEE